MSITLSGYRNRNQCLVRNRSNKSITDGRLTHRRVTNEKGYFMFEDLPPGNWTLTVSSALVPEYHHVETDRFELELTSGETETLAIRVLPEKRQIEIIDEGEILLESD